MPLTWELPVAVALAWVSVAVMLLPAGRGAASWLTGRGWFWPGTGAALSASLRALMTGHPSAGLVATGPAALPAPGVVYLLLALLEFSWLAVTSYGLRVWWRTWGPGMREGLAGRGEVEKVLGLSRMRRNRAVIRPDLYAKHADTGDHR
jgi:hypothetical protein